MSLRKVSPILILAALLVSTVSAGLNQWTINGPGGGNVDKLSFNPSDSSIVYAASDNGLFRSSDGGQHWIAAPELLGTSVFDLAISASDPQKVLASTVFGLYKSSDGGATWAAIHPFASFKVAMGARSADVVYSVATSGPIRSSDGGVTFGPTGSGLPSPPSSVTALAVDPQNSDTVYASFLSSAGVYKSVDGGAHWVAANAGLTSSQYFSLVADPSSGSTLYLGAAGGVFKTVDGGASWAPLQTTLSSPVCFSLAIGGSPSSPTLVAGTSRGVIESADRGATWTQRLSLGDTSSAVAIDPRSAANLLALANFNLFRSTDGGATFVPASSGLTSFLTQAIAVDPQNASLVYASGPAGIFKSTDRGESWSGVGPLASFLAVDPFNSLTLYAISSGSFRRSLDGGVNWQDFRSGLPASSAIVITADPLLPGVLYTVVGNAVYRKAGDDPWTIRNSGLPAGAFPSFVVVDPRNSSTLYTGGGFGLFKSVDAGATWTSSGAGITGAVSGVAVDPFDSGHLVTSSTSPVYESMDGGTTWTPSTAPSSGTLAFDPTLRGRLYDSTFSEVDRSTDGGKSWFSISTGLGRLHGNIFVVAPDGRSLYAGGQSGGVFSYTNGKRRAARS